MQLREELTGVDRLQIDDGRLNPKAVTGRRDVKSGISRLNCGYNRLGMLPYLITTAGLAAAASAGYQSMAPTGQWYGSTFTGMRRRIEAVGSHLRRRPQRSAHAAPAGGSCQARCAGHVLSHRPVCAAEAGYCPRGGRGRARGREPYLQSSFADLQKLRRRSGRTSNCAGGLCAMRSASTRTYFVLLLADGGRRCFASRARWALRR